MVQEGDYIQIKTDKDILRGRVMPSDKDKLILKLDSGYNLGLDKKKVKTIKFLSKGKVKEVKLPKVQHKKGLKKV